MYIHHLYSLTPGGPQATNHSNLHFNVIGVDEWGGEASIRISGHHTCDEGCTWSDRILLVSVPSKSQDGEGLPPAQAMVLPPGPAEVSQTIKLPVAGDPIRYPFDRFRLTLGVILQRVYPDGRVQALTPEQVVEDGRHLFLSMHMQAPRITISTLKMIDPASIFSDGPQYIYIAATDITFSRPLYLQLLTVSLVLLITAAAAYAVFMRLNQLVINSGALVLGVWGIRSILLGSNVPGLTSVDLALSVVILFLLAAITARALMYLQHRSGIRVALPRNGNRPTPTRLALNRRERSPRNPSRLMAARRSAPNGASAVVRGGSLG